MSVPSPDVTSNIWMMPAFKAFYSITKTIC